MRTLTILTVFFLATCISAAQDAGFTFAINNPCCGDYVTFSGSVSRSVKNSSKFQEFFDYRVTIKKATGSSVGEIIEESHTYKQKGAAKLLSDNGTISTVSMKMTNEEGCSFTLIFDLDWTNYGETLMPATGNYQFICN